MDLIWAAGDSQTRGFLIGATAGRTTLAGEGLQHQDGHSHLLASTIPNCISYDPTFAYELAVILKEGLTEAVNTAYKLRNMDIKVILAPISKSIKAQMRYANQQGAVYAVIVGEREILNSQVALKSLKTELPQTTIGIDSIIKYVSE